MCFRSDEEDEDKTSVPITSFFGKKSNEQVQQKTPFFDDRGLVITTTI